MNWDLAERLPETGSCRYSFKTVIAGYINAVYSKLKQNENQSMVAVLSQPPLGLGAHEDVVEYAKEILSGEITQKLLQYSELFLFFIGNLKFCFKVD